MKNILPTLLLSFLVLTACSDDENNNGRNENKNPYETGKDLSSSTFVDWDNKEMNDAYFMLGYGYDITGKYAHPSSIRNKVINTEECTKDELVSVIRSTSSGPEEDFAGTRQEAIETMGARVGLSRDETSKYKNLFKETFEGPFDSDSAFPDLSYRYHGISQVLVMYHLYFYSSSYMIEKYISKYLTDEFKNDLEIKSAEEIIKLYGTHILNGIKVGERIDYLYRYAADEDFGSNSWFLFNIHQYFSQGPTAWSGKPEKNPPLKENLYIEVVDGTRPYPNAWMIDITNYQGERIIFDGWENITEANLTLTGFRPNNCLIPIYEFVKDSAKKEELIKAYNKYLTE